MPGTLFTVPFVWRHRLPDKRRAITHHFSVGAQEHYVTVRFYEDAQPGEMFIKMSKEGSTISGLMDSFATAGVFDFTVWRPTSSVLRQVQSHALEPKRLVGQHPASVTRS